MEKVYEYRAVGRRPTVWAAAAVFLFLLVLALYNGAPWYVWAIWGPCAGMVLYMLICNPVSGLRLTEDRLTLSPWRTPQDIALRDIAQVEFILWSDSTDVKLHLVDGTVITTFSGDIPPRSSFTAELTRRGIPVTQS